MLAAILFIYMLVTPLCGAIQDAQIEGNKQYVKLTSEFDIISQVQRANTIYEVSSPFDLRGRKMVVPEDCVLLFTGGSIENGTIEGRHSDISTVGSSRQLFKDVHIQGTWVNSEIRINWINYSQDGMIQSILKMQNPNLHQEIIFPDEDLEWTPREGNDVLAELKSNCRVIISNKIKTRPNNLTSNAVFYINNQHHITIEGGEVEGDCETHIPIKNNTSEGCHGISIRGGHFITINNVTLRNHNGDGVYVRGISYSSNKSINTDEVTHLIISNCKLDRNRRQGISLCAAMTNVEVDNCVITNTGKINGTLPCAGIDVEPISYYASIKNLTIRDCFFKGNVGQAIDYNGYYYNDNITIDNCHAEVEGNVIKQNDGILLLGALNHFSINNCSFPVFNISGNKREDVSSYRHSPIVVQDSFFNIIYISNNNTFTNSDVAFYRCHIDKENYSYWKNASTLTLNLPISYSFDNCTIKGDKGIDLISCSPQSQSVIIRGCYLETPIGFLVRKGSYVNNIVDCLFLDVDSTGDVDVSMNKITTHSKQHGIRMLNRSSNKVLISANIFNTQSPNLVSINNFVQNVCFDSNKWINEFDVSRESIIELFKKNTIDNSTYSDAEILVKKIKGKIIQSKRGGE